MKSLFLFLVTAALALSAAADPVITSVTPNSAPVSGGTVVTIRGSGFATCIICSPPVGPGILFGGTPAESVQFVDSTTLQVTTPAHLPGRFSITVVQNDTLGPIPTLFTLPDAFTFTGTPPDGFETVLFPVFAPPVRGAFGSEFHTIVRAAGKTNESRPAFVYGIDWSCLAASPLRNPVTDPVELTVGRVENVAVDCSTWPARLLYVPKERAENATFNLRVLDVTRNALSQGTEIRVVRSAEIRHRRIVLLNVPIDSRFRNTLRVYSSMQKAITVRVTIGTRERSVQLQPGRTIFEPSIATLTDFPSFGDVPPGETSVRVVIDPTSPESPVWAMITVTNNDTQEITTITPD